jgi:hypothetical protein
MQQKISLTLTGISLVAGLFFANCKKEQTAGLIGPSSLITPTNSYFPTRSTDRIDAIVSDLAIDQYSLHFDQTYPNAGITKTEYGADNYVVYADPQDVICPEPLSLKIQRVPIYRIPIFVIPTCPDMVRKSDRYAQIQNVISKADPARYGSLKEVTLSDGGSLFAGEQFFSQYTKLQPDQIDKLTDDLDANRFAMFNTPGTNREFTRGFYGSADLNAYVLRPYKLTLKDIIKPTLKGCFDPIILEIIKQRLEKINPEAYKGLNVTQIQEAGGNAATLSF